MIFELCIFPLGIDRHKDCEIFIVKFIKLRRKLGIPKTPSTFAGQKKLKNDLWKDASTYALDQQFIRDATQDLHVGRTINMHKIHSLNTYKL